MVSADWTAGHPEFEDEESELPVREPGTVCELGSGLLASDPLCLFGWSLLLGAELLVVDSEVPSAVPALRPVADAGA